MNIQKTVLFSALALAMSVCGVAANAPMPDAEGSFLTDYSKLQVSKDNPFDESFLSPGARQRVPTYTGIMIDQPEMFVHPNSKYKGMKPDDMKAIADALREAIATELKGSKFKIVDQPGAGVLYIRMSVGDLMLQKKKRPILAYTPIGAVVNATKNMLVDVTSKVDVKSMKIEGEILDSVSQEQFAAMTASRGSLSTASTAANREVSWQELNRLFSVVGKRVRCRIDNVASDDAAWNKCGSLGLAVEAKK